MSSLFEPDVEKMAKEKDVEGLMKALRHKDSSVVQSEAAEALGRIGEPAIEPLIHALTDEDGLVRMYAAMSLGRIGEVRAEHPLIQALKDEDGRVRREAAGALGRTGGARAVEPLTQVLMDGDGDTRWYAAESLDELGWKPADDTEKAHFLIAKMRWGDLIILGEPAIEPLVQILSDNQLYQFRKAAEEVLEKIKANVGKLPMTKRLVHVFIYTEEPFEASHGNIDGCVAGAFPDEVEEITKEDLAKGTFKLRVKQFEYSVLKGFFKDRQSRQRFWSWAQSVRKGVHDLPLECEIGVVLGTPFWGAMYFPTILRYANPEFATSVDFIREWAVIAGKIVVIGAYSIVHAQARTIPPTVPTRPLAETPKLTEPPSAKKYCVDCGAQIPAEAVYCPRCGKRQIEEARAPPPEISQAKPLPKEPMVQMLEVRTEIPQLGGRTASEEVANLAALADEQERLLNRLFPISEDAARGFFGKLGVVRPNEYQNAIQAFGSFRSSALSSKRSAVHTWYLKVDPSSPGPDALYVHLDDPIMPVGIAVCKLAPGSFLGYYATRSEFKDKLGL